MIEKIKDSEIKEKSMSTLPTRPNSNGLYGETKLTPQMLKERMDALALLAIDKINELICGMQVGGDVAKTIRFKNGEEGVEYSLEELFSMIFEPEGLSNLLKTSIEITENGEQRSLSLNTVLNDIVPLTKSLEDDVNLIKKSKPIVLSTNEFDDSKLPSKIYYKVLEPEWVNTENDVSYYDFENLQFTTEADGNTLLGDVYSYVDEHNNRRYTIYPDYTPNIKEGTSAISLAVSDPENMLYNIKLEALFNGGYEFSFASKDASSLTGVDVIASGKCAFSSGEGTVVVGDNASGFGTLNTVRAQTGTAIGYKNIVTGRHGIAFNEGNKVLGYASMGVGDHNTVVSPYSFGGGANNKLYGYANFVLGTQNLLNGDYLYGFGIKNTVKGIYHGVFGRGNIVTGAANSITGAQNTVKGSGYNEVVGSSNNVDGIYNSVIGYLNNVTSTRSMVVGAYNTVADIYSLVSGIFNEVKAKFGSAIGSHLIANDHQLVIGSFNEEDDLARFIVGSGGSDTNRRNAFVVKKDGRAVLGADPEENMDAVTKQYLDKALKNYVGNDMIGDIESALDAIIQIQNGIIGGETA